MPLYLIVEPVAFTSICLTVGTGLVVTHWYV